MKYVIISPVRNEGKFIRNTLDAVLSQSVKPEKWIIVNDGSQDDTGSIIDEYAKKNGCIETIHRSDRGYRQSGTGVIEAFYDGYNSLTSFTWDFIVKLDGDVTVDKSYFETCFKIFEQEPKLGIGGGMICNLVDGRIIREKTPLFHVRGATKIYRKDCWCAIGGLIKAPGWDTVDEIKANMLGWKSRTFSDLPVIHHRRTGSADGPWKDSIKHGLANYVAGYHPVFMIFKCIRRIFVKPYVIGATGILYGFLKAYYNRMDRIQDEQLIQYIRNEQIKRITFRQSIWK